MEKKTIPLSQFITIEAPELYKLHAARWNKVKQPLDVYVKSKKEWRGWNTWRNDKDEFSRKYIFSLIDFYHKTDMWLFGGIYEVLARGEKQAHSYEIQELPEYSNLVGRLKISLERPSRGRAFYLEKHYEKMSVAEVLRDRYSGERFPGYENINHSFSILSPIFEQENPDWKSALENIKGIYAISDPSNGKHYIGSAYGEQGIWSRWNCYIGTGHGDTDELTKLIKTKGSTYADNFKLALLEYRSMKTEDRVIIDRETYWKNVFQSREFGYNKN